MDNSESSQLIDSSQEILSKVGTVFDIEAVLKKHPIAYTDSLASVLYQEVVSYNKLITVIKESIVRVQQALRGKSSQKKLCQPNCVSIFRIDGYDL